MELKKRSFQYGKVALAVRTQKNISYTVCAQSGHRLHGQTRVVEHTTAVELLVYVLVQTTPLLDETLFQVVDVANPGGRVAGTRPTPHSLRDSGQGYWAATAKVDEIWCIARQNSTVSPAR